MNRFRLPTQVSLTLLPVLFSIGSIAAVQAQITPDNTLGNEASTVTDATVQSLPANLIEGGAIRGANLFHSFTDFNVAELQRVYFANPVGIDHILSRVTGNSPSNLLGTLGVDGNASLFLLNPNGIVFGPAAELDITGSFFASTAEAFEFGEGLSYSATDPVAPPLLAITLTPGLQYGEPQQGLIQSEAQLQTGGLLSLQAETLNLQGSLLTPGHLKLWATDTVEIRDSVAQPFIAAAGEGIDIQANETLDISVLEHPDSGLWSGGDLSLRSGQPVIGDAYFWSGGQFQIEQLDGSPGNLISVRDPVIEAQGDVSFITYIGGSLRILAGGAVTIGELTIFGTDPAFPDEQVSLSRALPDGVSFVEANGSVRPVVDIRAGTTAAQTPLNCLGCGFFINEPIGIQESIATSADINIGKIFISQPDGVVLLTNQFQPDESLASGNIRTNIIATNAQLPFLPFIGNGGDVFIDSRGNIEIFSTGLTPGRIQTVSLTGKTGRIALIAEGEVALLKDSALLSETQGTGQGGRVDILANNLRMTEVAQIVTSTASQEKGGDIYIEVTDSLEIIGDVPASEIPGSANTGILSTIRAGANADGGEITIKAGSLTITQGAIVGTFIRAAEDGLPAGQGNSGDINVIVEGDILLTSLDAPANTGFDTGLAEGTAGSSGDINIEARNLFVQNAKFPAIRTDVLGIGDSGNIEIQLDESFILSGNSTIATDLREGGVGNAGDIIVDAQNIVVDNGAAISSTIAPSRRGFPGGQGTGGDIFLKGRDSITISQGSLQSVAGEDTVGPAGNIIFETPNLVVDSSSAVATITFNESPGGDIQVISDRVTLQQGSSLLSRAEGPGAAGEIDILADDRLTISVGEISASADAAGGGNVEIDAGITFFNQGSLLSTSVFDSTGGGGNITINADALVLIEDSDILANAELGPGGIITINSPAFLATLFESGQTTPVGRNPGSFAQFRGNNRVDISADSAQGSSGTVSFSSLVTDEGLNELPTNLIDPTSLIDQRCDLLASQQRQDDSETSQFTVVGRGGLPVTPRQSLDATHLLDDLGPQEIQPVAENVINDLTDEILTPTQPDVSTETIVEPRGWRRDADGRLYLYASSRLETADSSLVQQCGVPSQANLSSTVSR